MYKYKIKITSISLSIYSDEDSLKFIECYSDSYKKHRDTNIIDFYFDDYKRVSLFESIDKITGEYTLYFECDMHKDHIIGYFETGDEKISRRLNILETPETNSYSFGQMPTGNIIKIVDERSGITVYNE